MDWYGWLDSHGRAIPQTTVVPSLKFVLETFIDPQCNAYLNQPYWHNGAYKISYQSNLLTDLDYDGACYNANAMPSAIRNVNIANPSQEDKIAQQAEHWESLKFTSNGIAKLCLVRGFDCMGDWYEVPGDDVCFVPADVLNWGYLSYFIVFGTGDYTCGDYMETSTPMLHGDGNLEP